MRWLVLFVVLGWCVNGVAQRNDMKGIPCRSYRFICGGAYSRRISSDD